MQLSIIQHETRFFKIFISCLSSNLRHAITTSTFKLKHIFYFSFIINTKNYTWQLHCHILYKRYSNHYSRDKVMTGSSKHNPLSCLSQKPSDIITFPYNSTVRSILPNPSKILFSLLSRHIHEPMANTAHSLCHVFPSTWKRETFNTWILVKLHILHFY